MAEFTPASRGVANAGLTTGIIGTAFGAMNSGILPGLFQNGRNAACCDSDSMPVSRYDASKDARIAALETEVKLRDANTFTMNEMGKLRDYMESRLEKIDHHICDQAVWNATQTATIGCMAQQIAALNGLTKLIVPASSVCPAPMPQYNSWTAPTTTG
ncbi:MAG: hypothetical protein IKW19_09485 [Akkermansia sp.]|nr:hypothetical protein [Akkermansia sp.]